MTSSRVDPLTAGAERDSMGRAPRLPLTSAQRKLHEPHLKRFYEDIRQILCERVGLRPESRGVEFGCDRGLLAHYLANQCQLELSDLSDQRELEPALRCPFHQGRAEQTDFPDESLDFVILLSVYHHLGDFDQFTREARRILKPGGRLIVVEPIKSHPTILFLNALAPLVHWGNANWQEPYGLALWINETFIIKKLAPAFSLVFRQRLDTGLWGLNVFLPRPVVRFYGWCQRRWHFENTDLFVFERLPHEAT